MGNRSLFPESPCRMLSLVLSFASKESTIPRRGDSPIVRAAVGASDPAGRRTAPAGAPKGFPLALWKHSGPESWRDFSHRAASPITRADCGASDPAGRRPAPAGAPKGFPRGKQSARFALPCAPLVVCLNSESLTAFGGCIHWIPASLRSPLETFGPRKLARFFP